MKCSEPRGRGDKHVEPEDYCVGAETREDKQCELEDPGDKVIQPGDLNDDAIEPEERVDEHFEAEDCRVGAEAREIEQRALNRPRDEVIEPRDLNDDAKPREEEQIGLQDPEGQVIEPEHPKSKNMQQGGMTRDIAPNGLTKQQRQFQRNISVGHQVPIANDCWVTVSEQMRSDSSFMDTLQLFIASLKQHRTRSKTMQASSGKSRSFDADSDGEQTEAEDY